MLFQRDGKKPSKEDVGYSDKMEDKDRELTSANIKELIGDSSDVVIRDIYINGKKYLPVTLVFIDGLVDIKIADDAILKPLVNEMGLNRSDSLEEVIERIQLGAIYHASQKMRVRLSECISDIMDGSLALVFDRAKKAVTFDAKGYEKRSITEPLDENAIKSMKDSFVEDFGTNTATIRRKIKTCRLVIEEMRIGRQTISKIGVIYMKGITNRHIVDELKKRLGKINVDGVISSGIIEENIVEHKYSSFPQVLYTERPDRFCASILEGRAGLLIDGFPMALIVPGTLNQMLQAPSDYSQNFIISSILRFIRFILMIVTLLLPGFYIAVTTFHQEMIPTELALSIESAKEGVPFPSFVEVIFMLIAFEVLVEAGLRLPRNVGQAVSIVGALVVGQAAVEARLVSPAVVVTIAMTAISSFTMPNQDFSNALRLWRFIIVILASIIGLYGLSAGGIILLVHLSKMEVLGVPYLAPYVAEENKQMQDSLFRLPFSFMYKRPINLKATDKKRMG